MIAGARRAACCAGYLSTTTALTGLRVRPHLPAAITRYVQKFPVRFGRTRIYLTVTGSGAGDWTELHPTGRDEVLAVEILRDGAKPRGAWQPKNATVAGFSEAILEAPAQPDRQADFRRLLTFDRALAKAGLRDSYEAAEARAALELLAAGHARLKNPPSLPDLGAIPSCKPEAVNALYADTASWIMGGLVDHLNNRSLWREPVSAKVLDVGRQCGLIEAPHENTPEHD